MRPTLKYWNWLLKSHRRDLAPRRQDIIRYLLKSAGSKISNGKGDRPNSPIIFRPRRWHVSSQASRSRRHVRQEWFLRCERRHLLVPQDTRDNKEFPACMIEDGSGSRRTEWLRTSSSQTPDVNGDQKKNSAGDHVRSRQPPLVATARCSPLQDEGKCTTRESLLR